MANANEVDFLGDTFNPGGTISSQGAPQAPALTAAEMEENRRRKLEWLSNQGLDANGNPLPAYGTPQNQGGTANGFQITRQPTVGTGAMAVVESQQLGHENVPLVGSPIREDTYQVAGAIPAGGGPVLRDTTGGTVAPTVAGGKGAMLTAQTSQGTTALRDDIERRRQGGEDQMLATAGNFQSPLDNPAATQSASNQAENALGAAPTIDQGLADRGRGAVTGALDMQRNVFDKLLNGPNTAQRLGSQVLRNQLALARSAAGGPGAVQEALRNAQMAAPELQAAAAQAATAETLQRTQAAGNVAQGAGQTALGARGQDVSIAAANQQAASQLMQNVTQLTGQQLELDQRNQELLGQMARDLAAQNFNWGQLDAQAQNNEFERWIKTYGIDVAAAAQIRAAAANNDKGVMDYLIPIIGSAATLAASAL